MPAHLRPGVAPSRPVLYRLPAPSTDVDSRALAYLARGAHGPGGVHEPAVPQAGRGDASGAALVDGCRLADGSGVQARGTVSAAAGRARQRALTGIRIRTRPERAARMRCAAISRPAPAQDVGRRRAPERAPGRSERRRTGSGLIHSALESGRPRRRGTRLRRAR